MPIYEDENTTREKLYELRKRNRCQVCGGMLNVFLNMDTHLAYLACQADQTHDGIVREASQYEQRGIESLNIPTRRKIMEHQFGEPGVALEKYHGVTSLTRPQALEILRTVFPEAPEVEMTRAVLLCVSYHLNPLMGHVFLIPFKRKDGGKDWATVMGIKAKRLVASRRHPYSYLDDTPRIMTEEEQKKVFGKVDEKHIVAITILQDPGTRATGRGYGKWEKDREPYGTEKGNSKENMAFIRSESQALDRLAPGEMPIGFEVVDEEFVANAAKGKVIEGEAKEVTDEPAGELSPTGKSSKKAPKLEPSSEPTPNTIEALKETMQECNWSAQDVGHYGVNEKFWKFRDYSDLQPDQIAELIEHIKKNPK